MHFDVFTLFPAMFESPLQESILKRAREMGRMSVALHDIRNYAPKEKCWIKADVTFRGLRHVLHEPDDRIFLGGAPPSVEKVNSIEILRQLVLSPQARPDQLVRKLADRGVGLTGGQVRRVIDHYGLEKKRRR